MTRQNLAGDVTCWGHHGRSAEAIVIATSASPRYSESFIQAHLDRLPGRLELLTGKPLQWDSKQRDLCPWTLRRRVSARLGRAMGWDLAERQRRRAVVRYLRRVGARLVLAQYGTIGADVLEACRALGIPLVVHFRGYDAFDRMHVDPLLSKYRQMFAYADAVVVVSKPMWERVIELGADERKLHLIPSGTDVQQFKPTDPAANAPHFLAVGRFVEKKGPQLTLAAFAKVAEHHPEARLTMVGDGVLRNACMELAAGLGIGGRVSFPGVLSHEEVADRMRRARAFVQHSLTVASGDSEGTPGSVREASATGLPVIATRHAGIPEAVIDGETGLLVDERDVAGMASQMCRVIDDPALAARLGQAGRAHIVEHYDLDQQISKLWDVLKGAMAS